MEVYVVLAGCDDDLDVRLAGVFTTEQLARDAAEADYAGNRDEDDPDLRWRGNDARGGYRGVLRYAIHPATLDGKEG